MAENHSRSAPTSINEAGCIHTTQGLEFEYVGVIIGDDLRYENGVLITDFKKRASTDQSIKGLKKMEKDDPERAHRLANEIIKNTYRTLMTRGMKGCYVYATDKGLRDYLKKRVQSTYDYELSKLWCQPYRKIHHMVRGSSITNKHLQRRRSQKKAALLDCLFLSKNDVHLDRCRLLPVFHIVL